MTNEIQKNGLTKKQTLTGIGIAGVILLAGLGILSIPTSAASKVQNLQESVEVNQTTYNANHKTLEQAQVKYCESWKSLSRSKLELAKALNITTDEAKYQKAIDTDCTKLDLVAGF